MKFDDLVHTDTIVVVTNMYGEKNEKGDGGTVNAKEKTITFNGEVVYKEWEREPLLERAGSTSEILKKFQRQVTTMWMTEPGYAEIIKNAEKDFIERLLLQQSEPAGNGRNNRRNFIQTIKMIWTKLFS